MIFDRVSKFGIWFFIMLISTSASAGLFSDELGFGGKQKKFLPPEEAFVASAKTDESASNTAVFNFDVQEGYYLYKDKFSFTTSDAGVSVELVDLPKGKVKEDPLFGKVEVYYGPTSIPVRFNRENSAAQEINIKAAYQGCAEDGICYPPLNKTFAVSLAAAYVDTKVSAESADQSDQKQVAITTENDPELSESDSIAALLADKPLFSSLVLFFVFGLALSLTPCVYPMIPILSGILVGQGDRITTRRSFMLALTYVLGMALTYAVVGVVAGIFGHNIQAIFQNPWILATFAGVFVLLALSMFGFYELQLPSALQTRLTKMSDNQERGTLTGAGLMGIFSAIIVGPCVAPPLAGALIYIGQSGNGFLGGIALFVMGLGMGVPLLLLGASAGKLLPRAGVWMNAVKHVFGVLMLAVAIWLLERILPAQLILALWGMLLIGSAVYMRALDTLTEVSTGWRRLWKALGIALLIYGTLLIIGAASGADNVFQPLKTLAGSRSVELKQEKLQFNNIKGMKGLEAAFSNAHAQNKSVMLDFYADWCIECKRMEKNTFTDKRVQQQLESVMLLKADVTPNDDEDQNLLKSMELIGPPAILFFTPDGTEKRKFRITGYVDPTAFNNHIKRAFN
ncbi:MAG: protein-disulfide reductase DsbD [Gammaproteobacteria bacterium]